MTLMVPGLLHHAVAVGVERSEGRPRSRGERNEEGRRGEPDERWLVIGAFTVPPSSATLVPTWK